MTRFIAALCLAGMAVWSGCFDLQPAPSTPPQAPATRGLPGGLPGTEVLPGTAPGSRPGPAPGTELVPASADTAGTKGKGYGGGPITEPVHQYFRTQYRIVFLQIQDGLKYFKLEHERFPASFEEFEQAILKPANIRLPELPPGHSYSYDPQTGQLNVQRPSGG